jgi:hypothetical protein
MSADINCMNDIDAESLDGGDGSWRLVLAAYRVSQAQEIARNPESDGWLPRFRNVEGIEGEQLSKAHGQLIALGLLKFELAGRAEGIRYQVSQLGKQTLEHGKVSSADVTAEAAEPDRDDEVVENNLTEAA